MPKKSDTFYIRKVKTRLPKAGPREAEPDTPPTPTRKGGVSGLLKPKKEPSERQ